ncbi:MAG TPA: helicase C-terminal domain-containing protein [Candidatus Limnocylindrales bacterium]|nr:helicase C-terminal domain-containing protein [Candidatus Limnocylindrales bacterium]
MSAADLLAAFPAGAIPRLIQQRILGELGDALADIGDDDVTRVFLVEAPPGIGKSHLAMTLARWSGDAYLLTSQKLLQDQYEREFGDALQLVKGRDNYLCERYPPTARVTTSHGLCRRPRGPMCQCPYARAKLAALEGPIFCTNTAYFLTLRQWQREQLRRRRVLIVDEAHNLEQQLVRVFTVTFAPDQMKAWFGGPLPRLDSAEEYRILLEDHVERLDADLTLIDRRLQDLRPPGGSPEDGLSYPLTAEEYQLLEQHDLLESALARLHFFLDAGDTEWIVRYPDVGLAATLELVPLTVSAMAPALLWDAADIVVLSSAFMGRPEVIAGYFGLAPEAVRALASASPFAVERRRIEYRPVGVLSKATLPELEPALFDEVAAILARHPAEKGLVHAASYAAARRMLTQLADRAPEQFRRVIFVESSAAKARALEDHRSSRLPTVLLSPSLREGVDLPDDFLRFQIVTKMPFPDLGDPWTAARQQRDPRWYALETAKALVQAYGRSCRHADDHGVTYILDGQFSRFVQRYRPLLPAWFREAAEPALRDAKVRP